MDEERTARDVLAAAGRPPRPQLRDEVWAEMLDELDGSDRTSLTTTGRSRRWPRLALLGVAAAAMIAAVAVAVWPRDERATITDTDTVPSPTTVAVSVPATDAGPASTVPAPLTIPVASTVATPTTTMTTTSTAAVVPARPARAIGADGQSVELLASDGCGPGGTGCFTADMSAPELPAFRSGQVTIAGAGGFVNVTTEDGQDVPALPVPGGDWQFTRWPDAAPVRVQVRVDRADGSWDVFPLVLLDAGRAPEVEVDLPTARTVVEASANPADLPATLFAARPAENDLVRRDVATGATTTLVDLEPFTECADVCGVTQVSPGLDGTMVIYGGPGPAAGQAYTVPADGSAEPSFVFGGGDGQVVSPDGQLVAVDGIGLLLVGAPTPAAPPATRQLALSGSSLALAFAPDDAGLYATVAVHGGAIVVEADPADLTLPLRAVGFFAGHEWVALAVRADGLIVALRRMDEPGRPAVVDVVDPATGEIVDTVELRADGGATQLTEWIDFDGSGRYLLYTDGEGRLRWTDFEQAGILGDDGGWGDAGW